MKKNLFHPSLKGIAFALPLFVLFACCSSIVYGQAITITQSNCFTIVFDTAQLSCDLNHCNNPKEYCTDCRTFKIVSDKCTGLYPTGFTVVSTSNTDCHSVCSPGDFNIDDLPSGFPGSWCSWYNPRIMRTVASGGIPDLGSAKFTICHTPLAPPSKRTYTISLPAGIQCNGVDCTPATITF